MVGLPTEEDKDLLDIAGLAKEIVSCTRHKNKKPALHVSISTLVPKSHTPFMWEPQISIEESKRRIHLIQETLIKTPIQVKWNDHAMSWLEGIFSRGDRRLSQALILAWRKGARFDAWREVFKHSIWLEALSEAGIDPDFYLLRLRLEEEILPWDHIQTGVTKEFFKEEHEKSLKEMATLDCRLECHACGVCDHTSIRPRLVEKSRLSAEPEEMGLNFDKNHTKKYRMVFSKRGELRYLSHLELSRLLIRAFKRAGLHLVFSEGYHPMPKISFYSALPVGIESLHETIDIQMYDFEHLSNDLLKERLNRQMPKGIAIQTVEDITKALKSGKLQETEYLIRYEGFQLDQTYIDHFMAVKEFPIVKNSKKGLQAVNARLMVKAISFDSPGSVRLSLTHSSASELKAIEIIAGIFNLSEPAKNHLKVLKVKQVIG
jgi:radical SAM-linked protein